MNSFRNNRLRDQEMPLSTVWLLNDIAESRGKQELFTHQSPQALKALRDTAHPLGGTEEIRRCNLQRPGAGCALAFSRE